MINNKPKMTAIFFDNKPKMTAIFFDNKPKMASIQTVRALKYCTAVFAPAQWCLIKETWCEGQGVITDMEEAKGEEGGREG